MKTVRNLSILIVTLIMGIGPITLRAGGICSSEEAGVMPADSALSVAEKNTKQADAEKRGDVRSMEHWQNAGANFHDTLPQGVKNGKLYDAVEAGNVPLIRYWIDRRADAGQGDGESKKTLLGVASKQLLVVREQTGLGLLIGRENLYPYFEVMKELVTNSLAMQYINHRDKDGCTSLHYAASKLNEATVRLLLDHDADVNVKDNRGYIPIDNIRVYWEVDLKQLLDDAGSGYIDTPHTLGTSETDKTRTMLKEASTINRRERRLQILGTLPVFKDHPFTRAHQQEQIKMGEESCLNELIENYIFLSPEAIVAARTIAKEQAALVSIG